MDTNFRSSCRSQVTRLANAISEYLATHPPPSTESEEDYAVEEDLLVYLDRIIIAHENLKRANDSVKIEKEQQEREFDLLLEYEDKAVGTIARLKQLIALYRRLRERRSVGALTSSSSNNAGGFIEGASTSSSSNNTGGFIVGGNEGRQQHGNREGNFKLPKLELKKFSGDLREWLPFWEQFRTAVHENSSLTAAMKFNYLQCTLVGKAASTIAGFTPTQNCYNDAIELLQEQYGDTERIMDKYMQQLMKAPVIKSKDDTCGLRRLYNTICTSTRSLTALGVDSTQYSMMLKSIILRCMPADMRVSYHRTHTYTTKGNDTATRNETHTEQTAGTVNLNNSSLSDANVHRIVEFLRCEIEALERSGEIRTQLQTARAKAREVHTSTAAGLFAAATHSCVFCKSNKHNSLDCDSSMSVEERKDILRKQGCCYRCAKPNHAARYCKKFLKCGNCNGRHASVMCDRNVKMKIEGKQRENKLDVQDKFNGGKSNVQKDERTVNLFATNQSFTSVYLQTACCFAVSPNSSKNRLIRIVLDGGSQVTFIREELSRALDLPVIGTSRLSIMSFGVNKQTPVKVCKRVKLSLKSQYLDQVIPIEAIEVPEICLDVLVVPDNLTPILEFNYG